LKQQKAEVEQERDDLRTNLEISVTANEKLSFQHSELVAQHSILQRLTDRLRADADSAQLDAANSQHELNTLRQELFKLRSGPPLTPRANENLIAVHEARRAAAEKAENIARAQSEQLQGLLVQQVRDWLLV